MNNELIKKRRDQILSLIASKDYISIDEICEEFDMSDSMVRRDVRYLEGQGKIKHFHGGVSYVDKNYEYDIFQIRHRQHIEEKSRMGERAARLVVDGDVIYIGPGSTMYEFARNLVKNKDLRNVTIVTCTVNIASCFIENGASNFQVILLGGVLLDLNEGMQSKMTIESIKKFNFTKSFTSHFGITVKNGVTAPRFDLAEFDQTVLSHSRDNILLFVHTKFGEIGPFKLCSLEDVNILICDKHETVENELSKMPADSKTTVIMV